MKTAIITVGKEVLTGKTVNTNLARISEELNLIGIDVNRSFVIDDQKEEYLKILDFIDEDLIIFTGGLGPTVDDITRETVIEYFKVETYINEEILEKIRLYFKRVNLEMKDTNYKQALFPKDSIILNNDLGTAPGVLFNVDSKIIVLFPGPPHEMEPMLLEVVEYLRKKSKKRSYSKGFKLVGIGESAIEHAMIGFYELHPNVNIAPYAGIGEIKYVFTSNYPSDIEKAMSNFYNNFSEFIYGDLNDTLEGIVVEMLNQEEKYISMAESCTGGMLASRLVNVSGASKVFNEGFIVYSNESKNRILNVSLKTIEEFGAVSEECAHEMVDNLYRKTNANVSVSITGIAGPTGGTKDKPVGLVCFGTCFEGKIKTIKKIFNGNREMIRIRATVFALNLIRKELIDLSNF